MDCYLQFRLALFHSVSHFFFLIDHRPLLQARILMLLHLTEMTFLWSTPRMNLSFEILKSIIRTVKSILMELIEVVKSAVIFLSNTTLLKWLTFFLVSLTVVLIVLFFCIILFLRPLVVLQQLPPLGNSDTLFQFLLTFRQNQRGMPLFIAQLSIFWCWLGWSL